MSDESLQWLNQNTLIGYTAKRGTAWHYRASDQGDEPNHYPGPIPVEDVRRRLFSWEPVEAPLTALMPDGTMVTDPSRKVIVRSDTRSVLGVFSTNYRPHHYSAWLIDNVANLLDADLQIGSAGLLRGGAVGWVQIEMSETLEVAGVHYRPFLTAATCFDGSISTTYMNGHQVVICDNTLQAAGDSATERVRIRHSRNSLGRIQDVRDALKIIHAASADFAMEVESLTSETVTSTKWDRFVRAFTAPETDSDRARRSSHLKAMRLHQLWNADERVAPWAGTAYGVVAAVNTHQHHDIAPRGRTRAERNTDHLLRGKWADSTRDTLRLLASV